MRQQCCLSILRCGTAGGVGRGKQYKEGRVGVCGGAGAGVGKKKTARERWGPPDALTTLLDAHGCNMPPASCRCSCSLCWTCPSPSPPSSRGSCLRCCTGATAGLGRGCSRRASAWCLRSQVRGTLGCWDCANARVRPAPGVAWPDAVGPARLLRGIGATKVVKAVGEPSPQSQAHKARAYGNALSSPSSIELLHCPSPGRPTPQPPLPSRRTQAWP